MKDAELRIEGGRIFLRYPRESDEAEFIALNERSIELYKGLAAPILNAAGFRALIEKNLSETDECFLICKRQDGAIAGSINLSQIFRKGFQNAYLGYSLGADFIGNGYMGEAIGLILKYSFEDFGLHRIEANVQPENFPSIRVLQRCGFTKEGYSRKYLKIDGEWRDHERWAIIREDWESGNK